MSQYKPKYPVYVISKGRSDCCLTANFFIEDGVDFKVVVEPQEAEKYQAKYGLERVLILPFSNLQMGSTPARNWVWEHSKGLGAKRHWIFDDNIRAIRRLNQGKRIRCNANIGLHFIEEFTDRYENIGISGFNYTMFVTSQTQHPFQINCHVYSALLIDNDMPYRWRLRYNEDTDLCLQVVTNKLCTVLFNAFTVDKLATMKMKGGNTDELYQKDGRLVMAKVLERMWPDWVTVKWRFGRPQHVIKNSWKDFKTPLKRRTDVAWETLSEPKVNLKQLKETRNVSLRAFLRKYQETVDK